METFSRNLGDYVVKFSKADGDQWRAETHGGDHISNPFVFPAFMGIDSHQVQNYIDRSTCTQHEDDYMIFFQIRDTDTFNLPPFRLTPQRPPVFSNTEISTYSSDSDKLDRIMSKVSQLTDLLNAIFVMNLTK